MFGLYDQNVYSFPYLLLGMQFQRNFFLGFNLSIFSILFYNVTSMV